MVANILAGILAISIGTISLLVGWMLFRFILPIVGFLIGFVAGAGLGEALLGSGMTAALVAGLMGLAGGFVLGWLAYRLYTFGVLLIAVFLGAGLFISIMLTLGFDPGGALVPGMALVGGLVFALLTLFLGLEGPLLAVLTSATGASAILVGLGLLLNKIPVSVVGSGQAIGPILNSSFLAALLWAGLTVLGVFVQLTITRPRALADESP